MTLKEIRRIMARTERDFIRDVLRAEGWNQTRAAKRLDCRLSTLQRIVARHPTLANELERHRRAPGRPASEP